MALTGDGRTCGHEGWVEMSSLVDEFRESYIYWAEACEDVRTAYRRWQDSKDAGRALEFERYTAALDHEEYAADIYSFRTARLLARN
jgi:hypothetical protein